MSFVRYAVFAVLLVVSGCLPGSCQRDQDRPLFPSDSLSQQVAAEVPMDTLQAVWHSAGPEGAEMEFPRTVLFGPEGGIWVSDAQRNSVLHFSDDGTMIEEVTLEGMESPYLAGLADDTLAVLSPFQRRLDFFRQTRHVDSMRLPVELHEDAPLLWATLSGDDIYIKLLGEDAEGRMVHVSRRGEVLGERAMPGPSWRRSGLLRVWGDSLLSLSGFRPVVDILPRDLSANAATLPDTMALVGFDSPMLGRSRAFVEGDVSRGPILTESAAPVGDRLFVLNIRPGWIQVDVFDRQGQLERRLTQRETQLAREFYPRDLAVRERGDGAYEIAIVYTDPAPRLALFQWTPGVGAESTGIAGTER